MRRLALPITALLLSSCVCTNREIDFTLATEAPQVLRLEPDGVDRVKVTPVGQTPTIYYYAANDPVVEGYPSEVRWILTWQKPWEPDFDEVVIVEKAEQADGEARGLLDGASIDKAQPRAKSGRVTRRPEKARVVWSYQVLVKRDGATIGTLDPDVVVQKTKPTG